MMSSAIEKLSSGLRINKAADDAAGLSISQGLTSQINGLTQAVSNAQDGTNVAQIADGALGTAQQILQRMRTLVVQAGNTGTQDDSSLAAIGSEITSLNTPADQHLDADQVRRDEPARRHLQRQLPGRRQRWRHHRPRPVAARTSTAASSLGTSRPDAFGPRPRRRTPRPTATADLATIDAAITTVSNARSGIGATQNQLSYTVSNLQTAITNVTASRSNLTDADLATEVTSMTQAQILTQAATSVLAQANSAPQAILKLLQ